MNDNTMTQAALNKMTGAELVAIYNKAATALGESTVSRFATKPAAVRRTWAKVQAWTAAQPARKPAQPSAQPKAARKATVSTPAAAKPGKQPRGRGTNIQPNGEPLKPCRAGSKQAVLLDLLKQPAGATMGELMAALSWQESSVKTGFGWDMKQKGYGVRSTFDAEGVERFHLVVPAGQKVPAHTGA